MSGATTVTRHVGREVLRLAQDRIGHSALPRRLDDVRPSDLARWMGRSVTSVRRLDSTSGTTDRARLALDGTEVPESVFLKLPAGAPVIRLFGNLARLGENEVRFYREVRPGLDVVAPTMLGSAFEDRTKRYALVLDDLVAAGATFADATTSLEPAQTLLVLENLARLHGAYWTSGQLDTDLRWVHANRDDPMLPAITWALRRMSTRIARGGA